MKIPSLSALVLAALTGRVAAGNFEFMNFPGWYENFDSYDEWHRSLTGWGPQVCRSCALLCLVILLWEQHDPHPSFLCA